MCGINASTVPERELIQRMNQAIAHRGPDDSSIYTDNYVGLGHRRLSIIDLSTAANQPMFYQHAGRQVGIVFNGEIYNFQDVRSALVTKGYTFKTGSDTEVILASYLEWGSECVTHFNGMWAFVLYDLDKRLLFCSRDRIGKKPLYYYYKSGTFLCSSELKAIRSYTAVKFNVNKAAVGLYFGLGFIPAPHTIYTDVYKLEARQNLIYDIEAKRISKIWSYYYLPKLTPVRDKKQLISEGRALLKDSVRLRLIADVPVGAFLSGGLDSSTVVGEMADFTPLEKLHTFSVGFQGKQDETPFINLVKNAFGTMHHHTYFTEEDFHTILQEFPDIYDEPYSDFAGLPVYKLSKLARQYVTVALSGDGGDEIFGGYSSHVTGRRMDIIRSLPKSLRRLGAKLPVKKNLNSFSSLYLFKEGMRLSLAEQQDFYARALEDDVYLTTLCKQWMRNKLSHCLELSGGDTAEALRLYDLLYHTVPDHFLVKVDRASMACSLEVRSPFLDYRLLEYSQRIPREWKVDAFKTKKLMREIIKGIVPEKIVNRGKQGFTPVDTEQLFMDKRYDKTVEKGLQILADIDAQLHAFFKEKVLVETHRLYALHRIRLLFFGLWWERWQ